MPCLFPVLSVPFMKTTALKLTLGFGTGCFCCCCGDDWLVFCGDVAAFWKTRRKALLFTKSCNYRYTTLRKLLELLFLVMSLCSTKLASNSLQSHRLDSPSSCSRSWIQSQSRDRLPTLKFLVNFLSPSMQVSENCLKLNYTGQMQTNISPMSLSGWFHHHNGVR